MIWFPVKDPPPLEGQYLVCILNEGLPYKSNYQVSVYADQSWSVHGHSHWCYLEPPQEHNTAIEWNS